MEDEIRILLVDDEPLVRRSMEKTLIRAGMDVETAAGARDGLARFTAALEEAPFTLAIVDLHMPDLKGVDNPDAGLELLSELLARQPALPVIVLTAFDEVERAKEAITRGARAYFVKGREAGLLELVHTILEEEDKEGDEK
ncbi:MAG TPA: response regulator [Anaerolineae bacterium]|nr:response regulator [Anaerolineae bacterium]HRU94553.1 response regulator [Anaerolineae bacterium]HXK42282.1 response regulator [Anaerolineae bacterium]